MADYTRIYVMSIEKLQDENRFSKVYNLLDEGRRKKVDACMQQMDKYRSMGVWLLLRFALRQYLKSMNYTEQEIHRAFYEKWGFEYGEKGKPYFKYFSNLFFSLSHSGSYAACIISEHEVGIDLQKYSSYNIKTAKRLFSEERCKNLLDCTNEMERDKLFTCYFTQIEAIGKLSGQGILEGRKTKEELENFHLYSSDVAKGYAITAVEYA